MNIEILKLVNIKIIDEQFRYSKITGGHNPAFRVYDITESNRVADATTYFVDLDKLNSDNSTQFQVEYSYKEFVFEHNI